MFNLLIVDDDQIIRRYYHTILSRAGYHTYSAPGCEEALYILENHPIDLLLLDATMPEMDGYTFTKSLRDCKNPIPILMISARQLPSDLKKGFLMGVDDYMKKPVDEEELLLRIKALLRRAHVVSERKLSIGNTILHFDTLTVTADGYSQILPQKEFYLLYKLLSYPKQIFTRGQLMEDIWGPNSESTEATVCVHINRLRKRFKHNCDFSIMTIRGIGYKALITDET